MIALATYRKRAKRPQVRFVQRHTPRGQGAFLAEVRRLAEAGHLVRVSRFRAPYVDLTLNGGQWLAMRWPLGDEGPLGTFASLDKAVAAGDRWAEAVARGELDAEHDDYPRGAA